MLQQAAVKQLILTAFADFLHFLHFHRHLKCLLARCSNIELNIDIQEVFRCPNTEPDLHFIQTYRYGPGLTNTTYRRNLRVWKTSH